jgi:predicted  nucleic acid-binding Zn-ribbon protein
MKAGEFMATFSNHSSLVNDAVDAIEKKETARDRQANALAGKPELIRQQMDQHAEIVSSMRDEFGKKLQDLERTIAKLRRQLSEVDGQHETAIVKTSNGWLSITQILEQHVYRDACQNCREQSCEGCVPGYGESLREVVADMSIERWRRGWEARIR